MYDVRKKYKYARSNKILEVMVEEIGVQEWSEIRDREGFYIIRRL